MHTSTPEIYTLSLHDALPIFAARRVGLGILAPAVVEEPRARIPIAVVARAQRQRSEEHTSELQSPYDLVCRLLLEKKKYREMRIPRHTHLIEEQRAAHTSAQK